MGDQLLVDEVRYFLRKLPLSSKTGGHALLDHSDCATATLIERCEVPRFPARPGSIADFQQGTHDGLGVTNHVNKPRAGKQINKFVKYEHILRGLFAEKPARLSVRQRKQQLFDQPRDGLIDLPSITIGIDEFVFDRSAQSVAQRCDLREGEKFGATTNVRVSI
jgi:hypothetical protein